MALERASIGGHVQAQNFTRFAFSDYFKRTAANLAVRGETVEWNCGINHQFEGLAAERALDGFRFFHSVKVAVRTLNRKERVRWQAELCSLP
jgi:hypothetical protein